MFGAKAADAVLNLIDALDDESKSVRVAAVLSLRRIGPAAKAAIPALTAMTEEPLIGRRAKKAIKEIAGE